MDDERSPGRPRYPVKPETAAEAEVEPLPYDQRPPDGPVPRMSGGGPSLTDEPPDEESALGHGEVRERP